MLSSFHLNAEEKLEMYYWKFHVKMSEVYFKYVDQQTMVLRCEQPKQGSLKWFLMFSKSTNWGFLQFEDS